MIRVDKQFYVHRINKYLLWVTELSYNNEQRLVSTRKWGVPQWGLLRKDLMLPLNTPSPKPGFSIGALAWDSSTESGTDIATTFNVTVGANDNRMLIFGMGHYQGDAGLSGVTYNGDALTLLKDQEGSYEERAQLWGLVAPDTGTNSFVVSGAGGWTGFGVLSLYNADQNLPTNVGGSSGESNTASSSLTTLSNGSWVVAAFGCEPVPTMTTSGGVEVMKEQGDSYQNAEMHYVEKATAGSQTMSCSLSYGARWNVATCEVVAASGGGSTAVKDIIGGMGIIPFAR